MRVEQQHVDDVVIDEVDVPSISDDEIGEINAFGNLLRADAYPEDPPYPDELARISWRAIPEFMVLREFVARTPERDIVASAGTRWFRAEDNQHVMRANISVRPDRRGRGLGKAMLRLVADAAEEAGKTLLMGGTNDRVPDGEAFARHIGAQDAFVAHTNRLVLADVDRDLVRKWIDDGPKRAPGYSLIAIDGRYPDDLVEEIVDLGAVMNTAPRGDLDLEDETWTVEQARQGEESFFAGGGERWYLAARHDETGALVGWTEVSWNPKSPQKTVWQWGTGVRPEHRGHAIGKWLKAVMLERVLDERPDAIDIRTGNADSNAAMLGINKALGFYHYIAEIGWQIPVERVRAYLGS